MVDIDSQPESLYSNSDDRRDIGGTVQSSTSDSEDKCYPPSLRRSSSTISAVKELFEKTSKPDFCVGKYKTGYCKMQDCTQTECCYYHNAMEKRRNQRSYDYISKPCRYVYKEGKWGDPSVCKFRDDCHYAHTANEVSYHRDVYRTQVCQAQPCTEGSKCPNSHKPLSQLIHVSDLEATAQRSLSTRIQTKQVISLAEDPVPNPGIPISPVITPSLSPTELPREALPSAAQLSPSATIDLLPDQASEVRPVISAIMQEYSDLREQYKKQSSQLESLRPELAKAKKELETAVRKINCGQCRRVEASQVLQPCGHTECDRCAELAIAAKKCPICSAKVGSKCVLHLTAGNT